MTMVVITMVTMVVAMVMATGCQFDDSGDDDRAPVKGGVTATDDGEAGRCYVRCCGFSLNLSG